jgi:type 1 glutamine amidotransferase
MKKAKVPRSVSRRTVLQGAVTALGTLSSLMSLTAKSTAQRSAPTAITGGAWQERPMRWAQLAFTDDDPGNFDPQFWLDYFKRIHADGACLSAGGFTAYYPTKIPLHTRAPGVDQIDAFGVMVAGCRALGMNVIARVEPGGFREDVLAAHPEWVARRSDGSAQHYFASSDLYMNCALGGYNFEFITSVMREIVQMYQVDAIFTNRWATQSRCFCDSCRTLFRAASGREIPETESADSPLQRAYSDWCTARLLELAKLWNAAIRAINPNAFLIPNGVGGPTRDLKTYADFTPLLCSDSQARRGVIPPWENGKHAKTCRMTMGEKPICGIFSVGLEEAYRWKDSVQSEAEIRAWVASGMAQGFRPWVVKFNAKPIDRRWMPVVARIYDWHWKNERYLRNTANLARVAMLVGADQLNAASADSDAGSPADYVNGYYQALIEARIPFQMIYDRALDTELLDRYRVLILPNIERLSLVQCQQLRDYVARGGRLVATHQTSLYDESGTRRVDFGLADLFGCSFAGQVDERVTNSYLTLRHPHPLLRGLEDVPRVIGAVKRVHVIAQGASEAPLTLVASYTDLPMERVFTRVPVSDTPMVFCRQFGRGRVVYFPMDLDRTFWEILNADHLALLRNAVEWAAEEPAPLQVSGPGLLDIAYWRQRSSLTVHLVNLTNPMTMKGPYREIIPAGPFTLELRLPEAAHIRGARLLEADQAVSTRRDDTRLILTVPRVALHEIVALELA